jgi:hypothetical protein
VSDNVQERIAVERIRTEHTSVMVAAVLMAVGGWSGLVYLVVNTLPTVANRWIFFALLYVALSGTALPFIRYLNKRFARTDAPPVPGMVLVRQSNWVGLFGTACAWLRIPRVLSWSVAFFLALALVVIEVFLRLRERSQWSPED